jgi:formylglycine-generating enzyme required for sulfatase activity
LLEKLRNQLKHLETQLAESQSKRAAASSERDELKHQMEELAALRLDLSGPSEAAAAKAVAKLASLQQQINALDTSDRDAAQAVLIKAVEQYSKVISEKSQLLTDYTETSPTIQKVNATLAQYRSTVESALAARDKADSILYVLNRDHIKSKRAERQRLIDADGLRPTATKVRLVDSELWELSERQRIYQAGHARATEGTSRSAIDEVVESLMKSRGNEARSVRSINLSGVNLSFVTIPLPSDRSFRMGTPENETGHDSDERQISVALTKPYAALTTEVTQAMWEAVMKTSPWQQQRLVKVGALHPATYVSANGADAWCQRATIIARQSGAISSLEQILLPTEAQWEWMARDGTTTAYVHGSSEASLGEFAWYAANAFDTGEHYCHEVGKKKANEYGLFDISGNAREWCRDLYSDTLPGGTDPVVTMGPNRVSRGGSIMDAAVSLRIGNRFLGEKDAVGWIGFRPVIVEISPNDSHALQRAGDIDLLKAKESFRPRRPPPPLR